MVASPRHKETMPIETIDQPRLDASPPTERRGRGWHLNRKRAPHRGEGNATVEPIRSPAVIARIKEYLADSPRDFALFVVGIHFGLRGSDLLRLKWRDLTIDSNTMADELRVLEQKTGKARDVAIQRNAREALLMLHAHVKPKPTDFVFPSRKGMPLTIQRLHQMVNEWTDAVGARGNYGTHTLRKTFGYHLRMAGVGIEVIMKVFGHASQETTLRYIGVDADETRAARLKLDL